MRLYVRVDKHFQSQDVHDRRLTLAEVQTGEGKDSEEWAREASVFGIKISRGNWESLALKNPRWSIAEGQ
jgi:hypothetical protein